MKTYIADIKWRHHCSDIETAERFPDVEWYVRPIFIDAVNEVVRREEVIVGPENDLTNALEKFKAHELTTNVRVVERSKSGLRLISDTPYGESAARAVYSSGCIMLEAAAQKDGWEIGTLVGDSREQIKSMYDLVKEMGDAKLLKFKNSRTDSGGLESMLKLISMKNTELLRNNLSPKQLELFTFAYKKGYYGWPRKINIKEIAIELELTESTAREHLRKAEAKVMPMIAEMMDKLEDSNSTEGQ
ncbi:helix-turn-helix domain-containing protein [Candidatus Undinarchaeota archaeon]